MLIGMILTAAGPICYFIFCASILTMAFAFQGYVLFSTDVYDFRSLQKAFVNGLKYWVTEMDIDTLRTSNRHWGLIFFIKWTIIFLLILANVFVAILADAYVSEQAAVEEEEKLGKGRKTITEVLIQGFSAWTDKISDVQSIAQRTASIATLGASDKALELAKKSANAVGEASGLDKIAGSAGNLLGLADTDGDGAVDKKEMEASGMTGQEADDAIAAYDKDGNKKLSASELAAARKKGKGRDTPNAL